MAGPWEKYSQPQGAESAPAPAAGPWAKYQTPAPTVPTGPGAAQSGLEHFGNAASLGYLPHLQSLASQLTPDPNADVDAKLRAQGFSISQPKPTYISDRDANIKRLEQEGQEHPYASAAGTVGGAITSGVAANALAPINAATRFGRVVQAAKGGALLGALSNPGDKEGEVDVSQMSDRAWNAAKGGGLAGGGQGVIEGVSAAVKGLKNLPDALRAKAEERAFKSSGAMLKDYRVAAKQDRVNAIGRYMLDNGLAKPGMTVDDIAKAAQDLKGQHGEAIQGILSKLDEAGAAGPSAQDLASSIEKQAAPMKGLNTAQPTYRTLKNVAEDIRSMGKEPPVGISRGEVSSLTGKGTEFLTDPESGEVMAQFRNGKLVTSGSSAPMSAESASAATLATPKNLSTEIPGTFQGAQDIKKFVKDQLEAVGGYKALNPSEKNLALRQVYTMVKDKLEESAGRAAEGMGDKELLANYLASKTGYRNATEIAQIAKDQGLRQNANRFFSPTDYLSGATGAMIGASTGGDDIQSRLKHAAMGAGVGLAHKFARTYGTPIVSRALDQAGALLARTPLSAASEAAAPLLGTLSRTPVSEVAASGVMSRPSLQRAAEALPIKSVAEGERPKGEDRWAQQGLDRLGIQDRGIASTLMQSKETKRLLIEASDLPADSPRLQRIKEQIRKKAGK